MPQPLGPSLCCRPHAYGASPRTAQSAYVSPPMDTALRVEVTRGPLVESLHRVSAAVVAADGRLVASAGDPELVTFWRSAAKPFQALPLIQDGVAAHYGLTDENLAVACASHSSEPLHLKVVDDFLQRIGVAEDALACGPHPPLGADVAVQVVRSAVTLTPRWSNCSGKHAGMLALARAHGWPLAGYERAGHPVQERILKVVSEWTGLSQQQLALGVDGCTAVCFGLSLRAMALAYARLVASDDWAAAQLRGVILSLPNLIAGSGRLCTELMRAWPGEVLAKIGAEGIYSAALPRRGWGIALKVEDGDMRASGIALLAVLRQLLEKDGGSGDGLQALATLHERAEPQVCNTRGVPTGIMRPAGSLQFHDD